MTTYLHCDIDMYVMKNSNVRHFILFTQQYRNVPLICGRLTQVWLYITYICLSKSPDVANLKTVPFENWNITVCTETLLFHQLISGVKAFPAQTKRHNQSWKLSLKFYINHVCFYFILFISASLIARKVPVINVSSFKLTWNNANML